jgi:hypothetical protein
VIKTSDAIQQPAVIISGWYLNFIEYLKSDEVNDSIKYVYYINSDSMDYYIGNGFSIYYLPLQNQFNDIRYAIGNTSEKAKPFPG